VQRARGRLGAALGTYRQLLEVAAAPGQPALPAASIAQVGMAEMLYERGQLDAALDHATQGVALSRQLGWTRSLVAGLAILAWIRHAPGDPAGAVAAMREAERVQLSPASPTLFNPSRHCGPGWRWPTARSLRPPAGSSNAGSRRMTSPATRASASTWYWYRVGRPPRVASCPRIPLRLPRLGDAPYRLHP
jgi:MalT-like TPR region